MDFCVWAPTKSEQLSAGAVYWRELGASYVAALCALPGVAEGAAKPHVAIPENNELDQIAKAVPPMIGAEYLTADVLADLWRGVDAAFDADSRKPALRAGIPQAPSSGLEPCWACTFQPCRE